MAHRNTSANSDYEDLHATVVDAIDWYVKPENLDKAAHEVLSRLQDKGVSIPDKPLA